MFFRSSAPIYNEMLEDYIRSADHLTNLWSDEATLQLIDQQKKHMKLTLDKITKKSRSQ